jgi:hypothetical protein
MLIARDEYAGFGTPEKPATQVEFGQETGRLSLAPSVFYKITREPGYIYLWLCSIKRHLL